MVFGRRKADTNIGSVDDLRVLAREHGDKVQELREHVAQFEDVPRVFESDVHLFRFLKARHMNMKSAKQMLSAHFEYERTREHATISDFDVPAIKQHYPHGWHGVCKLGRPVYIECLGRLNISKMCEFMTIDRLMQYILLDSEMSLRYRYPICTLVSGKSITDSTIIFDLHGVSFSMCADRRVRELLERVLKISADHFPETGGRILVCRAPRAFSALYFFIKPLLQPETVTRIQVHSDFGPLYDWVDRDHLPVEVGGTSTALVSDDWGPWRDKEYVSIIDNISPADIDRAADAGRVHELVAEVRRNCAAPHSASTGEPAAGPCTPPSEPAPPTKQQFWAEFMDSGPTNNPTEPSSTSSGSPANSSSSPRANDAAGEPVSGSGSKMLEIGAVRPLYHSCVSRIRNADTSWWEARGDRVDSTEDDETLNENFVVIEDRVANSVCNGLFECGVSY